MVLGAEVEAVLQGPVVPVAWHPGWTNDVSSFSLKLTRTLPACCPSTFLRLPASFPQFHVTLLSSGARGQGTPGSLHQPLPIRGAWRARGTQQELHVEFRRSSPQAQRKPLSAQYRSVDLSISPLQKGQVMFFCSLLLCLSPVSGISKGLLNVQLTNKNCRSHCFAASSCTVPQETRLKIKMESPMKRLPPCPQSRCHLAL